MILHISVYNDNLKYYSYQSAGDLLSLLTSWITMRVGVYLYTDPMICRHFVRLMHHISLTSSSVQQWVQIDMPPVRDIHIYSSKEQLYYFTCCLTLGIYFKLQCTCLKFCHQKNKKLLYFIKFTNFHVSFILTESVVTGTKQPLFLSMITGIICNFPQIPENITSPKIS